MRLHKLLSVLLLSSFGAGAAHAAITCTSTTVGSTSACSGTVPVVCSMGSVMGVASTISVSNSAEFQGCTVSGQQYCPSPGAGFNATVNCTFAPSAAGTRTTNITVTGSGISLKNDTMSGTGLAAASCNLPWGGTLASGSSVTAWAASNPTYPTTCTSESRTCTNGTLSGSYTNQSCTQGYTYSWVSGSWGAWNSTCSASATRTRSVTCQRNDGTTVSDSFCDAGSKPTTSENSAQYSGCSAASITAPTNGATGVGTTSTITWGAASLASSYTLKLGTSSGGSNLYNGSATTATSYTPSLPGSTLVYATLLTTWPDSTTKSSWISFTTVSTTAPCNLPWGGTLTHGNSVTAYSTATVPYGSTCTSETRTCTNGILSGSYTYQTCTVSGAASCNLPWGGTLASGSSVTAYQAATVPLGGECLGETRTCTNGSLSGSYQYQSCSPPAACGW